ncbi:histidine phosphotransferase family protein [Zoogloea dura]|uniref:histidine phosphotransferase family protein n=1 Tax=Zoogloea dura TaxID=2728840 RepID=UPI0038B41FE0
MRSELAGVFAQVGGQAGRDQGVCGARVGGLGFVGEGDDGRAQGVDHPEHLRHRAANLVGAASAAWPAGGQVDGGPRADQLGQGLAHRAAGTRLRHRGAIQRALQGGKGLVGAVARRLEAGPLGRIARQVVAQHAIGRPAFTRGHLGRHQQHLEMLDRLEAAPRLADVVPGTPHAARRHGYHGKRQQQADEEKKVLESHVPTYPESAAAPGMPGERHRTGDFPFCHRSRREIALGRVYRCGPCPPCGLPQELQTLSIRAGGSGGRWERRMMRGREGRSRPVRHRVTSPHAEA